MEKTKSSPKTPKERERDEREPDKERGKNRRKRTGAFMKKSPKQKGLVEVVGGGCGQPVRIRLLLL